MQPCPCASLPELLLANAYCWLKLAPTLVCTLPPNGQVRMTLGLPHPLKFEELNLYANHQSTFLPFSSSGTGASTAAAGAITPNTARPQARAIVRTVLV